MVKMDKIKHNSLNVYYYNHIDKLLSRKNCVAEENKCVVLMVDVF